ncbi:MAG: hypothetical protein RIR76_3537, partial [Verrucomicrobiota bacterium]
MLRRSPVSFALQCLTFLILAARLSSQPATGTIEGRVLNTRNGEYLERARVTIVGTRIETFTDATGVYRLDNVPAGTAQVRAFHTGLEAQARPVVVAAGVTVQQDFDLLDSGVKPVPAAK